MEHQAVKLQCQRIGCNALFTEDDNPHGSCQYHESVRLFNLPLLPSYPLFHCKWWVLWFLKIWSYIWCSDLNKSCLLFGSSASGLFRVWDHSFSALQLDIISESCFGCLHVCLLCQILILSVFAGFSLLERNEKKQWYFSLSFWITIVIILHCHELKEC